MKPSVILPLLLALALGVGAVAWWASSARPALTPGAPMRDPSTSTARAELESPTLEDLSGAREATRPPSAATDAQATDGARVGVTLRGRVVDARGVPVAHAELGWTSSTSRFSATSGADGAFSFAVARPSDGWAELLVLPTRVTRRSAITLDSAWVATMRLWTDDDFDLGDVAVLDGGTIEGHVVSADGSRVAGASVTLADIDHIESVTTRTDARGEFVCLGFKPGPFTLLVTATGHRPVLDWRGVVSAGETSRLGAIVLELSPTITGVAVDERGEPAAGVELVARTTGEVRKGNVRVTTGANGAFTLLLDSDEPRSIEAPFPNGYEPLTPDTGAPRVDVGTRDVRVVLRRLPTFRFRVVEADSDRPIETFGFQTALGIDRGLHDVRELRPEHHPEGLVHAAVLPEKSLVSVYAPGFAPYEGRATADSIVSGTCTIRLVRGARILGRGRRGGEPSIGSVVTLWREGPGGRTAEAPWNPRTNREFDLNLPTRLVSAPRTADGRFEFVDVPPGNYAVTWIEDGFPPAIRRDVSVAPGAVVDLGDVELPRGACIEGKLTSDSSSSPSSFLVVARRIVRKSEFVYASDEETCHPAVDGTFRLAGLAEGTWHVDWTPVARSKWGSHALRSSGTEVELTVGATRYVDLDARGSAPAPYELHVTGTRSTTSRLWACAHFVDVLPLDPASASGARSRMHSPVPLGVLDPRGRLSFSIEGGRSFRLELRGPWGLAHALPEEVHHSSAGVAQVVDIALASGDVTVNLTNPTWSPTTHECHVFVRPVPSEVSASSIGFEVSLEPTSAPWRASTSGIGWDVELGDLPSGEYELFHDVRPASSDGSRTILGRSAAFGGPIPFRVAAGTNTRLVVP